MSMRGFNSRATKYPSNSYRLCSRKARRSRKGNSILHVAAKYASSFSSNAFPTSSRAEQISLSGSFTPTTSRRANALPARRCPSAGAFAKWSVRASSAGTGQPSASGASAVARPRGTCEHGQSGLVLDAQRGPRTGGAHQRPRLAERRVVGLDPTVVSPPPFRKKPLTAGFRGAKTPLRQANRRELGGERSECRDAGAVTFDKMGVLSKVWLSPRLTRPRNRRKTNLAAGDTTVGSKQTFVTRPTEPPCARHSVRPRPGGSRGPERRRRQTSDVPGDAP